MSLRQKTISGLKWVFLLQFSEQTIRFTTTVILARILLPEEFGLIGMISIVTALGITLIDGGMVSSIIRSQRVGKKDYSTVFIVNLLIATIFYLICYILAPYISNFYNQVILTKLIRVYCISLLFNALWTMSYARLIKNMLYKTLFKISLPTTLISSFIGISLAVNNFGVWSLVWMQLFGSILTIMFMLLFFQKPTSLTFDVKIFKKHFGFGSRITLSSIITIFFDHFYSVIMGRFFTATQVGYYSRSFSFSRLPIVLILAIMSKATGPMFAEIQNDNIKTKAIYRKILGQLIFITAPLLMIMIVLADRLFYLILTEKWMPAVPYFRILCIVSFFYLLTQYSRYLFVIKGRSDLYLNLELFGLIFFLSGSVIALKFGIYGLLWFQVICSAIIFIINTYFSGKLIKLTFYNILKDVLPIIAITVFAGLSCFFTDKFISHYFSVDIIRIIFSGLLAMIIYISISAKFRIDSYLVTSQIIKEQIIRVRQFINMFTPLKQKVR